MTIKELQESKSSEENAVLLGQLSEMGQKTRKFIRYSSYLITLLIIISFWRDLLPAFTFLDIELWTTNKKVLEIVKLPDGTSQEHLTDKIVSISFVNLLGSICLLWITIIIARHIPWILEMFALRRFGFDTGGIFAVKTITSYLITLLGISFSLHLIGIGWAKVQWLIAAMSVGLGFGLQEIFANFISGLIILFEQPMRVGDIISIGNNTGTVTQIKIRATTITNWDNREVIIPNKEFITGELINWTLTNNTLRHIFKIGVSYGSDIKKVQEILLDVAANCKKILHDPPSKALLSDFGDSSLNFELRVYIDGMDGWADFIHSVNYEIEKKLTEANITIPFPQRDVHIINH
jgi:potassium efflux system protein